MSSLSEVNLTSLKEGRSFSDVIAASVNPLEQEFDDNAGEELELRRDKDKKEVMTCGVEPSPAADVAAISKKGAGRVTKKEDSHRYSNFQSLLNFFFFTGIYYIIHSYLSSDYITLTSANAKDQIPLRRRSDSCPWRRKNTD